MSEGPVDLRRVVERLLRDLMRQWLESPDERFREFARLMLEADPPPEDADKQGVQREEEGGL